MVAKKTNNKARKGQLKKQPRQARVPKSIPGGGVEKAVRDYISLLKDPCNGPLVGPVGATANGYITRFEKTINVNMNQPNFALRWAPGALTFSVANKRGLSVIEAPTAAGVATDLYNNDVAPGYAYLRDTAQTFRCLAACAQIRYTDTEVNRKGIVASTISTAARDASGATGAVQEFFSITVDRARVPDQSLEVLWQPNDGDEMFIPVSTTELDSETQSRKNAILLAGTGCLTGSISVRLVVVYQWTPGSNDSIVLPVPTPGTGITMARVVQLARQAGFMAGHLIKGYATGGLYGVAREAASMIKPSLRSMA